MCNPASSQRLSVNALRIGLIEIGLWFMHHQHDIESAKDRAIIERHIATATAAQKLLATTDPAPSLASIESIPSIASTPEPESFTWFR
jgi:hypothetical protein